MLLRCLKILAALVFCWLNLPLVAAQEPSWDEIFHQHSSVMLLIEPKSGEIIDANPAASRFYGHTQAELRRMRIQDINTFTPEQVAEERKLAASEGRNYFLFRHRLADDSIRTVAVNSHPYNFSGRPLLFSIINDITPGRNDAQTLWHYQQRLEEMVDEQTAHIEAQNRQVIWVMIGVIIALSLLSAFLAITIRQRNQLEKLRKEDHQRLSNILWGTDVGTWEWNVQTGETRFNERWAGIIGYRLEELLPVNIDTWTRFVHPDDLANSGRALERHFSGESESYECEVRMHHKGGEWVWVLDRGKVVERTPDGKPLWMAGTHLDINARKTAELALARQRDQLEEEVNHRTLALSIAKEQAEAASRAKTTFLANMSHELRTPLNAIMGMTALALRRQPEPQVRDPLEKATQASAHLLAVINDVLDISKIEADRLTLENTAFQLPEVLKHLQDMFAERAQNKGLQLEILAEEDLGKVRLMGDKLRLEQILINLIGNAIKFTTSGEVSCQVRRVAQEGEHIRLSFTISDSGMGIDPETESRLFTAFEQGDNSMTRRFGGTGLGLAISRRLARLMDGDITVESKPGVGSKFCLFVELTLPAESHSRSTLTAASQLEDPLQTLIAQYAGTRILLAEDEPINQEVACTLLEEAGLCVDLANDGEEAVTRARENTYALILLDMQMPKLNGCEAAMAIRKLPGYAQTPILAMTANAFEEDRRRSLQAGMNEHLSKPVDPEHLFRTLLAWLSDKEIQAAKSLPASTEKSTKNQ